MKIYNIGFRNSNKQPDETQLDVNSYEELIELIDSLKEEMDIQEIEYIELVDEE